MGQRMLRRFGQEILTPAHYEPPGFKSSNYDSFQFEDEPVNIKLGDVATPFHNVKMRIKTDKKQFDFKDEGAGDTTVGQPISNSGLDIEQDPLSQQALTFCFLLWGQLWYFTFF
ncbi:hypothetical protein ACOMHN_037708 [Nucella lapillus]